MKAKLLTLILLLVIYTTRNFAQDVTTTFYNSNWVESSKLDERGALYQVRLSLNFTYVTIKVEPTKNKKRQNYWTSANTYVYAGSAKLPLLGAQGENNTYHSCSYNDNWGWSNVTKGQTLYYTLIFSGRIPEGITTFSLIDEASSGRGYSFRNYTINNPLTHSKRDEAYCKANADQNNDGICGIYEEIGGNNYRLACIKENGKYCLVYLGCSDRLTWWFPGDLKAFLEESATLGAFKANWVMQNKTMDSDAYVTFDGKVMKSFLPNGEPSESSYMKMYPNANTGSSGSAGIGSSIWTGTGFSLTEGYIVTNYHVVENAKSIIIQGVNGNFTNKHTARVIATDKINDIALLKLDGIIPRNIPYSVKTITSDVGEDVWVLGYPLTSTMGDEIKLTTGVVSAKSGFEGDVSLYQISAPIQPGNSGGPVFDGKGNLIGIICAHHRGAENVSYAIKASYLRNLIESSVNHDILPKTNKISTLNLAGKVKAVKNYVYYITCSNTTNSNTSVNYGRPSSNGNSSSIITHNYASINTSAGILAVTSVEVKSNETVLTLSSTNNLYGGWMNISKDAYIIANGKKYMLIGVEGITYSPEYTYFSYRGQTKSFKLHFQPIPQNTTTIDFIESSSSAWKIYNISLK